MKKTNPFVHLTWPFALLAVCAVLGFETMTIAMSAIFVAGTMVVCSHHLIDALNSKSS